MAVQGTTRSAPPRVAFFNDPVIRGIIYQIIVATLVIAFFIWIITNTAQNLAAQNKSTGFDFLFQTSGFGISFTLIPFDRSSFYWEAFLVGLLNTLLVAAIGIFFATILGFVLGIARLSSNWLIARFATVYVEIVRNIPLLLQLFFWYFAVLKAMPAVRDSLALPLDMFVNQRGLYVPRPLPGDLFSWVVAGLVVGLGFAIWLAMWSTKLRKETGHFPTAVVWGARIGRMVVAFLIGSLAVVALGVSLALPELPHPVVILLGGFVLAAVSQTPLAAVGYGAVAFAFAWAISQWAIGGALPFLPSLVVTVLAIAAGVAGFYLMYRRYSDRPSDASRFPTALFILVAIGLPVALYYLLGSPLGFEPPALERFNFRGGLQLPPEFVALAFGLSIYTAAFIAENVRSGIQAVNKGQTEAAQSLGLREGDRLRLVIVPQAMRVIIPPLTSQYLNLTKNSSLGAAIGYPELVNVFMGTTLNQTGKAIEVIAITMAVYLTLSLTTSAFMNWYNARVALVER